MQQEIQYNNKRKIKKKFSFFFFFFNVLLIFKHSTILFKLTFKKIKISPDSPLSTKSTINAKVPKTQFMKIDRLGYTEHDSQDCTDWIRLNRLTPIGCELCRSGRVDLHRVRVEFMWPMLKAGQAWIVVPLGKPRSFVPDLAHLLPLISSPGFRFDYLFSIKRGNKSIWMSTIYLNERDVPKQDLIIKRVNKKN